MIGPVGVTGTILRRSPPDSLDREEDVEGYDVITAVSVFAAAAAGGVDVGISSSVDVDVDVDVDGDGFGVCSWSIGVVVDTLASSDRDVEDEEVGTVSEVGSSTTVTMAVAVVVESQVGSGVGGSVMAT